jgi:hypothetical protein
MAIQDCENYRRESSALRMENSGLRGDLANASAQIASQSAQIASQSAQISAQNDVIHQQRNEITANNDENSRLRNIIAANGIDAGTPHNNSQMNGINGINHMSAPTHTTNGYPTEQYDRSQRPDAYTPRAAEQLPPIRNINAPMQGPDSMSGVQYQNEPRTNGYRPDQRY